ncbi:hypothetical protein MUO65_05745, partial [bacterium]|nr:hypothetical protein [bacterium]
NGICFMGYGPANGSETFKYGNRDVWIDDADYKKLFEVFRTNKTDPDILLVHGVISKEGTIHLGRQYMVKNGMTDYIIPGNYSVELADFNGQVIANIPFLTGFYMYADPIGIIETDFAAFTLAIPYNTNVSKLQIQYLGEKLLEINPNIKLLHHGVDSIPDYGFVKNPDERRNALHNKIDALEKMIEQGKFYDAIDKLKYDIQDKFRKWLVDGYQKENPLQLSKEEIIALVEEIIKRLSF